jgi:hypothetical protein
MDAERDIPIVRLDDASVEAVAQRLFEKMAEQPAPRPELVGASELARRLGVSLNTVYREAERLGGVAHGRPGSKRPKWIFDLETALASQREPRPAPAKPPSPRRRRAPSTSSEVPLLRVKGDE